MRASRRARSTGPARWAAIVGAAAAVIVGVAVAAPERHHTVAPSLQNASDSHAATASLSSSDPLSNLAPAAVPVNFQP
jgi:hypothetical protein